MIVVVEGVTRLYLIRTLNMILLEGVSSVIMGVNRRGASVYRSLIAPRGSSIGFQVEIGQLRGCAGAHGWP